MSYQCKHGHVSGVMQRSCKDCQIEALQEELAAAHERAQDAEESLRFATEESDTAQALLRKWLKAASGDTVGNEYALPLDHWGTGGQETARMSEAELERELLGPTRDLLSRASAESATERDAADAARLPEITQDMVTNYMKRMRLTNRADAIAHMRAAVAAMKDAKRG